MSTILNKANNRYKNKCVGLSFQTQKPFEIKLGIFNKEARKSESAPTYADRLRMNVYQTLSNITRGLKETCQILMTDNITMISNPTFCEQQPLMKILIYLIPSSKSFDLSDSFIQQSTTFYPHLPSNLVAMLPYKSALC